MLRPKLGSSELLAATELVATDVGKKMLNQDAYVSPHEMFGYISVAYNDFQRRIKGSNKDKIEVEELSELLSNIGVEIITSIASLYVAGKNEDNTSEG